MSNKGQYDAELGQAEIGDNIIEVNSMQTLVGSIVAFTGAIFAQGELLISNRDRQQGIGVGGVDKFPSFGMAQAMLDVLKLDTDALASLQFDGNSSEIEIDRGTDRDLTKVAGKDDVLAI